MTTDVLGDKLDKLANKLADDLITPSGSEEPATQEKTSLFKALTNYYAVRMKIDPPDDEGGQFGAWRKLNETTNPAGNGSIGAGHTQAAPARRPRK